MIYKDEKLVKHTLDPESPFYAELSQLRELGSVYVPDETMSFYKNLVNKYKFDLRVKCLNEILDIKRKFYLETGLLL